MSTLATKYDLRYVDSPIKDQGDNGACWAFALPNAVEAMMRLAGHELAPLSNMQYYNNIREAQGTFNVDTGSNPPISMGVAQTKGFAYESSFEYTPDNLYQHPSAEVQTEAYNTRVSNYSVKYNTDRAEGFVNFAKTALSEGKEVILVFKPQSFFFNEYGPLSQQVNSGPHDVDNLLHAVVISGLDDGLNGGSFIIQNQWGQQWGDNGYGSIAYSQFASHADYYELKYMYTVNSVVHDGSTYDFTYTKERVSINTEYVTILGRAGDLTGVDFWAGMLKAGASKSVLADALVSSTEGQLKYAALDNTHFVDAVYQNVLGRDADTAGEVYWTNALTTGGITRGKLFSDFIDSVMRPHGENHDLLTNKVGLADFVTIALRYDSDNATQAKTDHVQELLSQVTSNADSVEILKVGLSDFLHA